MKMNKIDIVKDFGRYQKDIKNYLISEKNKYYASNVFNALQKRTKMLDDFIDNKFPKNKGFVSDVSFPIVRERYLLQRAFLRKSFSVTPFVTATAIGATPPEYAFYMSQVVNTNLDATNFVKSDLQKMIDRTARYGTFVAFSSVVKDYKGSGNKTIYNRASNPLAIEKYTRSSATSAGYNTINVLNHDISPLNYWQEPGVPDPNNSPTRAIIDAQQLSCIIKYANQNPQFYIKENMEKAIKEARDGARDSRWHSDSAITEGSKVLVPFDRIYTKMPIAGNESDDTWYYCEMIGENIVRFHIADLDEDIVPIVCGGGYYRPDAWWRNSDSDSIVSHQNAINLLVNMKIDSAMQQIDRIILYRDNPSTKMSLDDLINRRNKGGLVPFRGEGDINQMLSSWQPTDNSGPATDWVMREIKESMQRITPSADMLRGYNQGGLANNTLGAAQMVQQQAGMLENDLLSSFSDNISELVYNNMVLIQQFAGDKLNIPAKIDEAYKEIEKYQILGKFKVSIDTSYANTDYQKFVAAANTATTLMNLANAGVEQIKSDVNWTAIVRDLAKKSQILRGDLMLQDARPPQEAIAGNVPTAQMPGQEFSGGIPANIQQQQPQEAQ
jgi:hypothetical protein